MTSNKLPTWPSIIMTPFTELNRLLGWKLFIFMLAVSQCSSLSPPGKPTLRQCHSPDKETFTCWWEPGADDGEDTTYRLLYEKELAVGVSECPDYQTAGKNSCFFDKNHTSIWVDYFLTVVAINAFGNTSSNVKKIDVADIVKPNAPENVTLRLELSENSPAVHISWNPYMNTKFGWITPKYQLRFKKEDANWIVRDAGVQTHFSLYSVTPGKLYMVQVRCAIDNGAWSEWSLSPSIHVPGSMKHVWIMVSLCTAIPFFAAVWITFSKRTTIKQWLLPPVPGPKIKGVDANLLKSGLTEEVTRALLTNQSFPSGSFWKTQTEEYVDVCDHDLLLMDDHEHSNGRMILNHLAPQTSLNRHLTEHSNGTFKVENRILDYVDERDQLEIVKGLNYANAMEAERVFSVNKINIMEFVENGNYVDVQRQAVGESQVKSRVLFQEKESRDNDEDRHEDLLPQDYTRVKEVHGDNTVRLQDPPSGHDAQWTDRSQRAPCVESLNDGYVDNTPAPLK